MSDADSLYHTSFSVESMKVVAESIGINNLPDDAAKELSDDVSFKLKMIIQVNLNFFFCFLTTIGQFRPTCYLQILIQRFVSFVVF